VGAILAESKENDQGKSLKKKIDSTGQKKKEKKEMVLLIRPVW